MTLTGRSNAFLRRFGFHIQRIQTSNVDVDSVTLVPDREPVGRVLLSYILKPLRDLEGPCDLSHTHNLESVLMARTWLQRGYIVDAIDYRNNIFVPQHHYDWFTGARLYFAEIADRLGREVVKVVHLDTSHFAVNNRNAYARLADAQIRKGVSLFESIRILEHNNAMAFTDAAILLGNRVTADTFRFAGKPLFELDVPSVLDFPPPDRDAVFNARGRFLWLGSNGLLHKGLDLVLEAFARMPEVHLTVCGPIEQEAEFVRAYAPELALPNVECRGWIDVGSESFQQLVRQTSAMVYPSCGEGQAGALVNCIRAGLIPIASQQSGVEVNPFGIQLDECSVDEICTAVTKIASMDADELYARSRAAANFGEAHFSRAAYTKRYNEILDAIECTRDHFTGEV